MKSLEELKKLREEAIINMEMRNTDKEIRVVVGMATCGIAAGARPVLAAFMDEVSKRSLQHVAVAQTGCIGVCRLEPIVEVYKPDQEKVTYVKVTPDMVAKIVTEHIVNDRVVDEYTIGYYEKNHK